MFLIHKNSIINYNITRFWNKVFILLMIFYSIITDGKLFPSTTTSQTACYAFIGTVWNLKPCFNTAIVNKCSTPQFVSIPNVPLRKMSDNGFNIGFLIVQISMKRHLGLFSCNLS